MENKANNGIFFLTLSFICIWIVIDNIWGKRYLDSFLSSVFPFYNGTGIKNVFNDNVNKYKDLQDKLNKDTSGMTKEEKFEYASTILRSGV